MRIIFLNSWFAKTGKPFFDFINNESSKTDVFCFMEFSPELFETVSTKLIDFKGFIGKGRLLKYFNLIDCQAIYIKNNIKYLSSEILNLYRNTCLDTGFAFCLSIEKDNKIINILDVHGKAHPGHKFDTPARIGQSQKIIDFMKDKKGMKIIGGDFNLNPDTKSVKMFEEAGYRNLIKEFDIKSTRNKISWDQFKDEPGFYKQYFADYCFVSKDVKVKSFEVPYNEISDHLPLILDFEV